MNRAQRWRLISVASAAAGALALAAVAVFLFDAAFGGDSGARVGDHWHAPYEIYIGEELQPPIPETITPQGIHTHGDGIIHIHPHIQTGEGNGAKIANFFGDQGGRLTISEMRIPGRPETYRNGEDVDGDGKAEELRVLRADSGIHPLGAGFAEANAICNALPLTQFAEVGPRYVVQDGDCIRLIFGETGS